MCNPIRKYFTGKQARASWTNRVNVLFTVAATCLVGAEMMFDQLQGLLTEPKHLAVFIVSRHLAVTWARNRKNSE